MNERYQIYRCAHCGNVVELLEAHNGTLSCCSSPMTLVVSNTTDASQEKHIPIIKRTTMGYMVTVGSVTHPMDDKHYIEMIELSADGHRYTKYLNPGDEPSYEFYLPEAKNVSAREYCNLHGLWQADK